MTVDETIDGVVDLTIGAPEARGSGSFLRVGEVFGPWRLLEHIADGGFGAVWRASAVRPVETDRGVVRVDENAAVKFFSATTEAHQHRIAREVALAERLGGQWTPEYFGSDLDAIPQWAAFEFITDATLRDLVRSTGPFDGHALEVFAEDLWDALAFFRRNGVAHRDLTPANVHVHAKTAKPRVIDWGNARDASSGTHTPYLPRTAGYAAPEQVEGRATGPAADLWSWAAVVTYAATGHPPLPIDGYHKAIIACDVPLDIDGVPPRLFRAVEAALRWDPNDRDPDQIAGFLPGRRAHVELEVARAREVDLDEAIEDLQRHMQLRDERIEELDDLIGRYERERSDAAALAHRLADAEDQRDDAAREITSLRARVAQLENERDAAKDALPAVVSATSMAMREAKRSAMASGAAAAWFRRRSHRLERKLHRARHRHRTTSIVPVVSAGVFAAIVAVTALVRATWEFRLLPVPFLLLGSAGVMCAWKVTARSPAPVDQARAGALGVAVATPLLLPLLFSAGALPFGSLATWVVHAPFVTPPPPDSLGVGHGAGAGNVDPDHCTEPLPANSHWDVLVVDC